MEQEKEQKRLEAEQKKQERLEAAKEKRALETEKKEAKKEKKAPAKPGKDSEPEPEVIDITGRTAAQIAECVRSAFESPVEGPAPEVHITGSKEKADEPLRLEISAGRRLRWQAKYSAELEETGPDVAAITLMAADPVDGEDAAPAEFWIEEPADIDDHTPDGFAVMARGTEKTPLDLYVKSGRVRGADGSAIHTDGRVYQSGGSIEGWGSANVPGSAVIAGAVQISDGLVFGRIPASLAQKKAVDNISTIVSPLRSDMFLDGCGLAAGWIAEDGAVPNENGSQKGLIQAPEDADVWWEVNPDGTTDIFCARQDNVHILPTGTISLKALPAEANAAGNNIRTIPIVFKAKTKDAERDVLLDIEWGWDLFLTRDGSQKYDNRIAVAACALSNAVYSEQDIDTFLTELGFGSTVLSNYERINVTSAYTLASARITDGRSEKTVFAVVNRGSKTIWDWKGNIVDETIQQARYFDGCAQDVLKTLQPYVAKFGCERPEDNIFLVTGHSLGGVVADILGAAGFSRYPAKNVFVYAFASPLAPPDIDDSDHRPIYNLLNEKDIVTSIPPNLQYKRLGTDNISFVPSGKKSPEFARMFRFLSHMDIEDLERMNNSPKGFFKQPLQAILWNHSLTTYMAYLIAGGPGEVKTPNSFLWNLRQSL